MMNGGEKAKGKSKATAIEVFDSDTEAESPTGIVPGKVVPVEDVKLNVVNTLAALVGDRGQMERERLERQKKRQREAGVEEDDDGILPSVHKKVMIASIPESSNSIPAIHSNISTSKPKASEAPFYYSGIIQVCMVS